MNSLQEQRQHYAAVRRRLWSGTYVDEPPRPRRIEIPPEELEPPPQYIAPNYRRIYLSPIGPQIPHAEMRARRLPRGRDLIREFALAHDIEVSALISPKRSMHLVRLRQELMVVLYAQTTLSLPQIGALLGGRDHTTILHGIRKHCEVAGIPVPPRPEGC